MVKTKITKKALNEARKWKNEIGKILSPYIGEELDDQTKTNMSDLLENWIFDLSFQGKHPSTEPRKLLEAFLSENFVEADKEVAEGSVRIVNLEQPKWIMGLNVTTTLVTGLHADGLQDKKYKHSMEMQYLGKDFKTDFYADTRQGLITILSKLINAVENSSEMFSELEIENKVVEEMKNW